MKQKRKKIGSLLMSLVMLLSGTGLLLAGATQPAYAAGTFEVHGEEFGLRVQADDHVVETGNLNPGDIKESFLTVYNDGQKPFSYTVDLERVSGTPQPGEPGDLFSRLLISLTCGGKELYSGPMSGFAVPEARRLGAGAAERLDVSVHLPGPETGNDYQGSTVRVKFIFRAFREPAPPPPPPPPGSEPSIRLVKTADTSLAAVGDTITYSLVVTNTNTYTTLNDVRVIDEMLGIDEIIPSLSPGQSVTLTGTYIVSEADLPGPLLNNATVEGHYLEQVVYDEDDLSIEVVSEIIIKPEEPGVYPRTGETPPFLYRIAGALLIATGIFMAWRSRVKREN